VILIAKNEIVNSIQF